MAMAAVAETSFSALLSADSEHALPDSDADVVAMLNDSEYGIVFAKNKPPAFQIARLDLLACLLWLHAHKDYLAAA